jgi:cysteine desulfuration protein SufE
MPDAPTIRRMTQIDVQLDHIIEGFEFLEDWEDRYRFLLDLGKKLPALDEADRTDTHKVHGCQSQVWMTAKVRDVDGRPAMEFSAESDAFIVNGLIAILLSAYNGKSPREVIEFDAEGLFKRLDLVEHLSPTRRNGLHSMIGRIREMAVRYTSESSRERSE